MRTDNYIYKQGHAPEGIRTLIPSKNRIFSPQAGQSGLTLIGNLSSFSTSESRTVEAVRGIGKGVQIAELVPGVVEPLQISAQFFALYLADIHQIFGYNGGVDGFVRSLKHHQWPFDIKSEIVLSRLVMNEPGASGNTGALGMGTQAATTDGLFNVASNYSERAIVTIFEACWIQSYSKESADTSVMVTENVEIVVSDVIDGRYTLGLGAATGNEPSSPSGGSLKHSAGTQTQDLLG